MSQKKIRSLRRSAEINFNKSSVHPEPFNHYFRRIKKWYKSLNWKEKTLKVPTGKMK